MGVRKAFLRESNSNTQCNYRSVFKIHSLRQEVDAYCCLKYKEHAIVQTQNATKTSHPGLCPTWYVLSKLSYINLVMSDVFPTTGETYVCCHTQASSTDREHDVILLPLCSPKKTSLNFLSGLPKSEDVVIVPNTASNTQATRLEMQALT